ncbi:hypothetical protein Tsp_07398 [Trichinella spiralis]|uniref:hypothetical protein n=1 Tax=Trichinella spiralis TaxID=6334 RepID=UPI0001EFCB3B|nr:hypothetical protein Tsp_07398 [Trichinella spiralis]
MTRLRKIPSKEIFNTSPCSKNFPSLTFIINPSQVKWGTLCTPPLLLANISAALLFLMPDLFLAEFYTILHDMIFSSIRNYSDFVVGVDSIPHLIFRDLDFSPIFGS